MGAWNDCWPPVDLNFFACLPGKTAAFILPVLERLIYKPRQAPVSRVLVLVPTRELGIQVHSVTKQLAQFSSITVCLAVGEWPSLGHFHGRFA